MKDGAEFEVIGDAEELKKEQEKQARISENASAEESTSEAGKTKTTSLEPTACKFSSIPSVLLYHISLNTALE